MYYDICEARLSGKREIDVLFEDGRTGSVHFLPEFFRGIFSKLDSDTAFSQFILHDGVLTWPGDLDIAPDTLHQQIKISGMAVLR